MSGKVLPMESIHEQIKRFELKHRPTPGATPDQSVCAACNGFGWKEVEQDGVFQGMTRCACWLASLPMFAQDVPREFQTATLDSYTERPGNRAALETARGWLDSDRDLFLCGGVGTGKTRLACSLLNAHYQRHRTGLFVRVAMLLYRMQQAFRENTETPSPDQFQACCAAPALVLDDVGVEKGSDYTRRMLLMLYEERCDRGLRTIWTSNLGLPELGPFLGNDDRLPSRIAGRADVVELSGSDWRVNRDGR